MSSGHRATYKELLNRVLKLQKRAARVILFSDRQASSIALFCKLHWIPFYEQCNIDKYSILYKRIHGSLPSYLDDHRVIDPFRLSILFSQYRSCDDISFSCSHAVFLNNTVIYAFQFPALIIMSASVRDRRVNQQFLHQFHI